MECSIGSVKRIAHDISCKFAELKHISLLACASQLWGVRDLYVFLARRWTNLVAGNLLVFVKSFICHALTSRASGPVFTARSAMAIDFILWLFKCPFSCLFDLWLERSRSTRPQRHETFFSLRTIQFV